MGKADAGSGLDPILVGLLTAGLLLVTLIAAVMLRLSCSFVGVRVPRLAWAVVVTMVSGILNLGSLAIILVGFVLAAESAGLLAPQDTASFQAVTAIVGLFWLPVFAAVSAGLYVPLLAIEFRKGLLVWLMELVIGLAVALVVFCVLSSGFILAGLMR